MLDCNLNEPKPATRVSLCRVQVQGTYRFLSVKSAVPGLALRLSAAPPMTIVIELPLPCLRMLIHDFLLTEHIPSIKMISRYSGMLKFDASVRRWGRMPGNCLLNSVPSVANVANAPLKNVRQRTVRVQEDTL